MNTNQYTKCYLLFAAFFISAANLISQVPTITGPVDPATGLPATLGNGATLGQVYTTEKNMTNYFWAVSPEGTITLGQGTNSITVDWNIPLTGGGQQTVSVTYTNNKGLTVSSVLVINYFPFAGPINPLTVPQFVDPLPHFAAGLRVNAKNGGTITVNAALTQQIALSTGTPIGIGRTIGDGLSPVVGLGNYAGYSISVDGTNFGPSMWPAQTIEAEVGKGLIVQYQNKLTGLKYKDFNILADQTLLENGFPQNGNILTDPYDGDIPMVVHLHGGEMPSNSDGGPTAWFMPDFSTLGPGFAFHASSMSAYPNNQEAGTLWYHPHDQGLTRINVYTGLAGFYFLRGGLSEDNLHFPGWSGDGKVIEVTPTGKSPTFVGPPNPFYTGATALPTAYLPEIEIAIQDRMFDVNGQLYWPVAPPNPEIHPFWSPEFFGDIMVVNGKSWPYLSVAQRKYRFRMLDGCNARFLNMWLQDLATNVAPPSITVIGSDGAFLDNPVTLNPALGQTLLMAPGERYDIIIDFTNVPAGTVLTLMNNANTPYPVGVPVVPGLTDRIMQFVVNGILQGADVSQAISTRQVPMVKLTDFAGGLTPGVVPDKKRQIILNEVATIGGPVQALFNNSHFDQDVKIPGAPLEFGGPTETPVEGTTELIQIINTTVDAHPIHIHLTQWQLVSRQTFDVKKYLAAYTAAWAPRALPEFPVGQGYPGGGGSPLPYDIPNADGAVGGNPAITPFLTGKLKPADPQEMVWKDDVRALPGEVTTYIVRYTPTDKPIGVSGPAAEYSFDPSLGPGYVWHCHIIDHEDMDMMRPLLIQPAPSRIFPVQPAPVVACAGDNVTYSVSAPTASSYLWEEGTKDPTTGIITWLPILTGTGYTGFDGQTLSFSATTGLSGKYYHCVVTIPSGNAVSSEALLTVNDCSINGTLKYNTITGQIPLDGFIISANGTPSSLPTVNGNFTIPNLTSGTYTISAATNNPLQPDGINATDAGSVNLWVKAPLVVPNVKLLAGDVDNTGSILPADATSIQNKFVTGTSITNPWVFSKEADKGITVPGPLTVSVNGKSVTGLNILGMSTGDFNGSFPVKGAGTPNVIWTNSGIVIPVPVGKQFTLPVRAANKMTVGAISLILNIPTNLITVNNVSVAGNNVPVTFSVVGNVLRIGWNSTSPVSVNAGGNLIILTLTPTAAFTGTAVATIGMDPSYLNEIADGAFNPIINTGLIVDDVSTAIVPNQLSASPNPASNSTKITYIIPVGGGSVNLGIYDAFGGIILPVINGVQTPAGTYTVNVNVSGLINGTYFIKLSLNGTPLQTITFVKK